jgi:hypothetical protein
MMLMPLLIEITAAAQSAFAFDPEHVRAVLRSAGAEIAALARRALAELDVRTPAQEEAGFEPSVPRAAGSPQTLGPAASRKGVAASGMPEDAINYDADAAPHRNHRRCAVSVRSGAPVSAFVAFDRAAYTVTKGEITTQTADYQMPLRSRAISACATSGGITQA